MRTGESLAGVGEELFGGILDESHYTAPDDVAGLVARHAELIGARDVVLYLVDLDQALLVPVSTPPAAEAQPLAIDTTLAGRAFRNIELLDGNAESGRQVWAPMLDGTDRIGVMGLTVAHLDGKTRTRCRRLAALAADLVVTKSRYGDVFTRASRRQDVTLESEIQWNLLPPLTFSTRRVVISGVLQPAYDVGGDSFDYALNGDVAHVAMFDSMGHGLEASLLAALGMGAYRHSRRRDLELDATVVELNDVVEGRFGGGRFLTALLGQLDCTTGCLRWMTAGHPAPLLVRRGKVVGALECAPTLPIGFGGEVTEVAEDVLEPGDRLLLYTDGVVEARSPQGEFFGEHRLADFLERATAGGLPAPETMRRLMHAILEHQQDQLQDDATTLFVEWLGPSGDTKPL